MIKKILIFAFVLIFAQLKSQDSFKQDPTWFFASFGGGYGNTMFFEKHFFEGVIIDPEYLNGAYGYQGKFGVNFPFNMGLAFELGNSYISQTYNIKNVLTNDYHKEKIGVNTSDKAIYIRGGSLTSGYLEFGPKFNTVKSAPAYNGFNKYSKTYTSFVFGFGGPLYFHNVFDVSLGLRLSYGLTNLMEKDNYPYGPHNNSASYSSTFTTNVFEAQIRLDIHWHIGYFAKSKCGTRTNFLFFQ